MTSLDTYHLFMGRPDLPEAIAHLPLAERVAEMRRPEVRRAILSEEAVAADANDFSALVVELFAPALPVTFPLDRPGRTTSPSFDESVWARATAAGIDPVEYMYDLLLADEGTAFYALLGSNFVNGTLDVCREMLLDPNTVTGLGDAGAHVNLISDCSASTFHLTHWARDRTGRRAAAPRAAGAQAERGQRRALRLRRPGHRGRRASGPTSTSSTSSGCASCPPVLRYDLPTGRQPHPPAGRGLPGHPGRTAR